MSATAKDGLGPVSADTVYPLPVFKRLTGMSEWALRQARRAGLKIRRQGNRAFVCGSDWHEFLSREAE